jgi:endoglucanase
LFTVEIFTVEMRKLAHRIQESITLAEMNTDRLLHTAKQILSLPTAPFNEHGVRNEILRQLDPLPHVSASIDDFGNVLAVFQRGSATPRWLLNAHMDHPAYVRGEFMGGVPKSVLETNFPTVAHGDFQVWDLPGFELNDGRIFSRACDDLIGCAAIVSTLISVEESGRDASFLAAFTCAEEVGLLGAAYLAKSGWIPKNVAVLSLETSAERPPAKMGDGVIVRVGDKTSVFDPALTTELWDLVHSLKLPSQRCLMSAGTCEATAYQAFGYRAAAICVALGNYHNCTPQSEIGSEYVSVTDFEAMTALCVAVVHAEEIELDRGSLRAQLERNLQNALQKWF